MTSHIRGVGATVVAMALATGALALACAGGGGDGTDSGLGNDRPNILFIVADDMTVNDLGSMPALAEWLGDEGTSFTNAFVSVSLCCPSRVTMLRGQYAHNTGVLHNEGLSGGFTVADRLGVEDDTVATWLAASGYRTGFVGKYLNFYPLGAGATHVPPGWDDWVSPVSISETTPGYDYTLNVNGRMIPYGTSPEDYAGTVYVDHAADFVTRAADAGEPFFAWLAMDAPHAQAGAAREDLDVFVDEQAPRTASFDRADTAGLPAWTRELPPLSADDVDEIDERHRERQASLRSMDRDLARLADVLEANGQLDDTYVVFTSDNGFHLGQHRLKAGKQSAFDEDVHVPFLVRGPGVPDGETSDALVANHDLAPTFAALAGADAPELVDGRSLAALWQDPGSAAFGRGAVLLEHWPAEYPRSSGTTATANGRDVPDGTGDPGDPSDAVASGDDARPAQPAVNPDQRGEGPTPPEFQGVRTGRYTYVEYVTGEIELYDDLVDPDQLRNLADEAPPALLADLAALVADLAACAGDACRAAEDRQIP